LISANLDYLVAKALAAQSLALLDLYAGKVQEHLEALEDAAGALGAEVKAIRRKYAEQQAQVGSLDRHVDDLLAADDDDGARRLQSRLNTARRLADVYGEQAAAREHDLKALIDAKLRLEAKLTVVRQERKQIEGLFERSQARAAGGATDASRDLEAEAQRRLARATAQGEVDAAQLEGQLAAVLEDEAVDEQLAERRRRLGLRRG
jgi:phage shock protein A